MYDRCRIRVRLVEVVVVVMVYHGIPRAFRSFRLLIRLVNIYVIDGVVVLLAVDYLLIINYLCVHGRRYIRAGPLPSWLLLHLWRQFQRGYREVMDRVIA